jgi:hypothetical protein
MIDSVFPGIREALADPRAQPMTRAQAQALLSNLTKGFEETDVKAKDLLGGLQTAALAIKAYPAAREFLLAQGWTKEQVEALPVVQAVLMHEVANYDRLYDDMLKWQSLSYPEARYGLRQVEEQLRAEKAKGAAAGTTLAALIMPATARVHEAYTRTERRLAALRCIEAIRLHAAAHKGQLPAALSDIRAVPTPADPFTGKSFEYEVKGERATLVGPPPAGDKPTPNNSLRYELTFPRK